MVATMKGTMDDQFTFMQWVGHSVSLAAIGGALMGLLPSIAAVAALIWYMLEIYESRTIQKFVRARRLQTLVKLRAKAVALELDIRNRERDLRPLDEANQIHIAAASKAADITHEAAKEQDPSG